MKSLSLTWLNNNKPKILLITDIFPPQIGGPATFIPHLAEKLATGYGYQVTVICTSDKATDESDKNRPYVVRRLQKRNSYRYKFEIRRLLIKEMLMHDCILINGLETLTYQIARVLRKPYILKIVGDSVWEFARNTGGTTLDFERFQMDEVEREKFKALIEKRNQLVLFAQHVVTPSNYLKHIVHRWGIPLESITTIANGSNLDHFLHSQNKNRINEPLRVLFVGRLTNWKGVETLLLAMTHVDNVHARIVGDGPGFLHLIELAKQLNIADRVEFTGRVAQREVEKQMADAHVLVLTSLYEGLSHTLLEAMASGLPCIASNLGGNAEVITSGKNGFLIEPQNVQELAKSLKLLETNEGLRQYMSGEAKASSLNFSLDKTVQAYIDLLIHQTKVVLA